MSCGNPGCPLCSSYAIGMSPADREFQALVERAMRPNPTNWFSVALGDLINPAKAAEPAKPTPPKIPSSYDVSNDLKSMAANAEDATAAKARLDYVAENLEAQRNAAEDRALVEQALVPLAKLGARNASARNFVVAYRRFSTGETTINTLEGVEFGDTGAVYVQTRRYNTAVEGLSGVHTNMAKLKSSALAAGYYVATAYSDEDEDEDEE